MIENTIYISDWDSSKYLYVPLFFLRDWEILICAWCCASHRNIHSTLILNWKARHQCELAQMMRDLERRLMGLFNERPSNWPCEGQQGSPVLSDYSRDKGRKQEEGTAKEVGCLHRKMTISASFLLIDMHVQWSTHRAHRAWVSEYECPVCISCWITPAPYMLMKILLQCCSDTSNTFSEQHRTADYCAHKEPLYWNSSYSSLLCFISLWFSAALTT